jgi:hypothetical protein
LTIERDLIEKYSEKGDIILMGDFNARTGSEEDLIISDDTSHVPLSDNQYVIDTAVGKRSSHDSHIDTRGKELLDMCISNQLRILNGRISSLFLIFGFKNPFVKSSELLSFHMYLFGKSFSFLLIISL